MDDYNTRAIRNNTYTKAPDVAKWSQLGESLSKRFKLKKMKLQKHGKLQGTGGDETIAGDDPLPKPTETPTESATPKQATGTNSKDNTHTQHLLCSQEPLL
jgi:hypothetical protein